METLMLPFSPRFVVLTICGVVTALLIGLGIVDRKVFDLVLIPIPDLRGLTALGIRDLLQQNHAVLRNYPISAHLRFLLEGSGRRCADSSRARRTHAVFPRYPRRHLSARQDGARQEAVRHPGRRLSRGYEWIAPFGGAESSCRREIPDHDRRSGLRQAVFGIGLHISAMSFGALSPTRCGR